MKISKGFTLIELLTVIAILAIVLLISVPVILGVLDKAKKSAFKNQALLYIDALKKEVLINELDNTSSSVTLPDTDKSLLIDVKDIPMDTTSDIEGQILVTNNGNGDYTYVLYITDGEYKISGEEYDKITEDSVEKGNDYGEDLLYPTITNKYEEQTYNYKYDITKELILNGVSATDTTDGNITNKITYTHNVDTNTLGTYEIIYRVENSLGNYVTTKRTIHIKDIEAPTITIATDTKHEEINRGTTYDKYLEGITVSDNYDNNIEATYICKNGLLEIVECNTIGNRAGTYYIIYDAKDSSNNKYSEKDNAEEVKRVIVVKDELGPVIELFGGTEVTIEVGSTFTEPGYKAIDDGVEDVTAKVETSSNLNTNKVGTYTVEYEVIDGLGNRGIQVRTIIVQDTTDPIITNVTGNPTEWTTSATLTVEATDNYQLHATAYSFDNGATWQAGNSKVFTTNGEVKIKVRDKEENPSEVTTVNITKVDTTKPTVSYSVASGDYMPGQTITITGSDENYRSMSVHVYKDGNKVDSKSSDEISSNTYSVKLDSSGEWKIYTTVYDMALNTQEQTPNNGNWYYQEYHIMSPYTITNLIKNGSFENGNVNNFIDYVDNQLPILNSSKSYSGNYSMETFASASVIEKTFNYVENNQIDLFELSSGDRYYCSTMALSESDSGHVEMLFYAINYGENISGWFNRSLLLKNSTWGKLSQYIYYTGQTSKFWLRLDNNNNYKDITAYFDDVICVNLTETFGAGNEPTEAWCDENISYFDGTTTIYK